MIDCLIIGDSIAQGVSQYERHCVSYTEVGISPKRFNYKFTEYPKDKATTVISLGSNNPGTKTSLITELSKTRTALKSKKIIWILPNDEKLKKIVKELAMKYNDNYVEFDVSKDNVHPRSYQKLDTDIKGK